MGGNAITGIRTRYGLVGLFVRGAVTAGRSAVCEPVVRARVRRRTSGWDPADLG